LPPTCTLLTLLFLFTDAPAPQFYTLSLHDALPISVLQAEHEFGLLLDRESAVAMLHPDVVADGDELPERLLVIGDYIWVQHCHRSEEHTSELQSLAYLVCRLLLEKKK